MDGNKSLISEALANNSSRAQRYLSLTTGGESFKYSIEVKVPKGDIVERSKVSFENEGAADALEGFESSVTPRRRTYTEGIAERITITIRGYKDTYFVRVTPSYMELSHARRKVASLVIRDLARHLRVEAGTLRAELGEGVKERVDSMLGATKAAAD